MLTAEVFGSGAPVGFGLNTGGAVLVRSARPSYRLCSSLSPEV